MPFAHRHRPRARIARIAHRPSPIARHRPSPIAHRPLPIAHFARAPAVEIGPLTGLDEAGPVEGVLTSWPLEHGQLRVPQGIAAPETGAQSRVVRDHGLASDRVADGPQTHDHGFGTRQHERTPQSIHAFAVPDFTDPCVARRERDEFRSPEIQAGRFERGEHPVTGLAVGQIRASKGKTRAQ